MKIKVRRPAILFAIFSAIYWEAFAAVVGAANPIAGVDAAPYWLVTLLNVLPPTLYAIIALIFCHWLARRVFRQAQERFDV